MHPHLSAIVHAEGEGKQDMSSLSILIADDEPLALKSMEMLIRREFPELTIAGTAVNGIDAKNQIGNLNPDIVIIDIQMPGISGLEVIELMKKRNKTHYIISTAYSNFEYIHKALDLRADGYLLKPGKREETVAVIRRTIQEINDEKEKEAIQKKAKLALHAVNPALEKEIIISMCRGSADSEKYSAWKRINNLNPSGESAVAFVPENSSAFSDEKAVLNALKEVMQNIGHYLAGVYDDGVLAIVLVYQNGMEESAEISWRDELSNMIAQHLQQMLGTRIKWAAGRIVTDAQQLSESWEECLSRISMKTDYISDKRPLIKDVKGYVQTAEDFIRQNFGRDISLEQCSEAIGISSYYLSHIFHDETGVTFVEYLSDVRMTAAKKLCLDSSVPLKEVPGRCGYPNISYFYKVFKKATGMTIGDYRKKVLEEEKEHV